MISVVPLDAAALDALAAMRNASARVLEKLGFRRLGEVIDPEDGPVWRWEWEP
ncbi:MAG: hypothetical protein ACREOF_21740 [Gemmatimonadales bacterium]